MPKFMSSFRVKDTVTIIKGECAKRMAWHNVCVDDVLETYFGLEGFPQDFDLNWPQKRIWNANNEHPLSATRVIVSSAMTSDGSRDG